MLNRERVFLLPFLLTLCIAIPPPSDKALMGRYILHNVDWVAISTISTLENVKGYPFVNLVSVADGPVNNGTGVPYFLMTDLDLSGKDVRADNRMSVIASLAEINDCHANNYDPQDPRCARIILTGKCVTLQKNSDEYKFAVQSLESRHPMIPLWLKVHHFYFAKLQLEQVYVLDYFGGASLVAVDDYLRVRPSDVKQLWHRFNISVDLISK